MKHDLRLAFRGLVRSPGYAAAAIVILSLGIGGATAVFSVLHAILIQPLPYAEPARLAILWTVNAQQNLPDGTSPLNLQDWRARNRSFTDLTAYIRPNFTTSTVMGDDRPERVHIGRVTWNFFDVIEVAPLIGRTFSRDDLDAGTNTAIISTVYAEQRFDSRDTALGRSLVIAGVPHEIIGVMPASVALPYPTTMVWTLYDDRTSGLADNMRGADFLVVLGRLRDGISLDEARRDIASIAEALATEYPATNASLGVSVHSLLSEITGKRLPQVLWMTFAAAVLVLLIAATNVTHLTLARGSQRRRELAIRSALGAGRGRLVQQLVIESLALAAIACAVGILLAHAAMRILVVAAPSDVPRLSDMHLVAPVLLLAIGLSLIAGPIMGLIPALVSSRTDPADALREGARGTSAAQQRIRRLFVIGEVAIAVVLLAEGGLLVRSVRNIWALDPGFDAQSVMVAQIDISGEDYPEPAQRLQFFRTVLERVRALPEAERAGYITDFFIQRFPDMRITVEGRPSPAPDEPQPRLTTDLVFPGFFDAIGAPLLAGRDFQWSDVNDEAPTLALINRAMADAFWPGESPVGKRYGPADMDDESDWTTVIGVVPNLRRSDLEETPYPQAFLVTRLQTLTNIDLAVYSDRNTAATMGAVRRVLQEIDPNVPLSNVVNAWDRLGTTVGQRQMQTWLLGLFSGLATLIAAIGLYALVQEFVVARRREIGIRVALGATTGQVYRLVMREGLVLALIGLTLGLVGSLAAARITQSMFYDVSAIDPLTLATAGVVLLSVAGLASLLPARHAGRVHPVATLTVD